MRCRSGVCVRCFPDSVLVSGLDKMIRGSDVDGVVKGEEAVESASEELDALEELEELVEDSDSVSLNASTSRSSPSYLFGRLMDSRRRSAKVVVFSNIFTAYI